MRRTAFPSPRGIVGLFGLLALVFLGGTLLAPWVDGAARGLLVLAYAPVCHQIAERSLEIGTGHQAVCARCSGIYSGVVAGLLISAVVGRGRFRRIPPGWLVLGLVPTAVDAIAPWLVPGAGLANFPRWFVSLPAGLAVGILLARALREWAADAPWRTG